MATAAEDRGLRPLDPDGLAMRIAPFAGALLVGFAFVNLRHDGGSPGRILIAAAVAALLVLAVGAVPWRILPEWTQVFPPLAFFLLVALLIDVDGGSESSFAPLALVPVIWLALYGTRGQLLVGILGAFALFLVPMVFIGEPRYPSSNWQTPTTWMLTAALVGVVVHELVRETRLRAERVETASSSDELTSLPSRTAWNERLPQELARAQRETWQLSVALFVLDGLDPLRAQKMDDTADSILRETAFTWASQLRATDMLVRYDDNAFATLFPGASLGAAMQLAERLRTLAHGTTVAGGIACWDGEEDADALMGRVVAAVSDARALNGEMIVAAPLT